MRGEVFGQFYEVFARNLADVNAELFRPLWAFREDRLERRREGFDCVGFLISNLLLESPVWGACLHQS